MTMVPSEDAKRRPDWAALAIAGALAVLSAALAYDASQIVEARHARVGPAAFPYGIAVFLFCLAVWTAIEAWRGRFPEREEDQPEPILWIVGGLTAQLLLLNTVGFSIATGILFAAAAAAFGKKQLWKTIPIGILLSLGIWLVFSELLRLRLPAGPLERLVS